jgi:hypothetical protein
VSPFHPKLNIAPLAGKYRPLIPAFLPLLSKLQQNLLQVAGLQ